MIQLHILKEIWNSEEYEGGDIPYFHDKSKTILIEKIVIVPDEISKVIFGDRAFQVYYNIDLERFETDISWDAGDYSSPRTDAEMEAVLQTYLNDGWQRREQ